MEGGRGKEGGSVVSFWQADSNEPVGRTKFAIWTSGPTQSLKLAAVLDGVGAGGARFAHVPLHRHALITALY